MILGRNRVIFGAAVATIACFAFAVAQRVPARITAAVAPKGQAVAAIPRQFLGDWGKKDACKQPKHSYLTEGAPFVVKPVRLGDYNMFCEAKNIRLLSSTEVTLRGECAQEGGPEEDDDDGVRTVTITLSSPKILSVRYQKHRTDPARVTEADDYTEQFPKCPG